MNIEHIVVNPTKQTGVMLDGGDGGTYPETVLIAGYHINTPRPVETWAEYEVFPNSPQVVYAGTGQEGSGVTTHYYSFPDKETFDILLDDINESD